MGVLWLNLVKYTEWRIIKNGGLYLEYNEVLSGASTWLRLETTEWSIRR